MKSCLLNGNLSPRGSDKECMNNFITKIILHDIILWGFLLVLMYHLLFSNIVFIKKGELGGIHNWLHTYIWAPESPCKAEKLAL